MLTRIYGTAFLDKAALEEHLRAARGGPRPRPPQARARARACSCSPTWRPGMPFWLPKGTHVWNELTQPLAHQQRGARLHRGAHADPLRRRALEEVRPLARLPRPHVLHGRGGPADGPEADELPGARADLPARRALLPRPPDPLRRAGPRAPPRAQRNAPRPAAGAPASPRTTPTCSARRSRSRRRCFAASTSASSSTTSSASSRGSSCPRVPRSGWAREEMWDRAEDALQGALESRGLEYDLNEGDGAFYGPKIDLHMTDTIGRSWQLGTVQLDYYMPEQFELTYTGADNAEHRPAMIHRALMGSFERFIGILIEHYAGELPLWLAPVQAIVLPIADRHVPYAHLVATELAPARHPGGGRRPHRVGRAQDPRRGAAEDPLHARGGRQGGGRPEGGRPPPPRGRLGRRVGVGARRPADATRSRAAPRSAAILAANEGHRVLAHRKPLKRPVPVSHPTPPLPFDVQLVP